MSVLRAKLLPTVEVVALFLMAWLAFRVVASSPLRDWELALLPGKGYYVFEYAAVALVILAFSAFSRRSLASSGVTFAHPGYLLRVVLIALLPFLALGATLSLVDWHLWPGTLVVSAVALAVLVIIAKALRRRAPPSLQLVACVGLGTPVLLVGGDALWPVLINTLYVYLLVGPAEEFLFRGYVLSRLNEGWGRPYSFFDVRWGFGVVAASVLFGIWHVALMPDQEGVWLQAVWTTCAGLSLGYLRERTGSMVPSSLLHSILNYLPFADLLAR